MSINLSKGQKIAIGHTNVTVGLGWTPAQGTGSTVDLDCSVFMLNEAKVIPSEKHFIFYNNPNSLDGAINHSGDDRTGANSVAGQDDEKIKIDVTKMDPSIKELLFVVTIDQAKAKQQNFGQVKDAYIRIVNNEDGSEIAKYDLGEDFSIETSIEFGRIYQKDGAWKFDASGIGWQEELDYFVNKYYAGEVSK